MKTAKLTLMFLACAAAIPAVAQNTTDSRCGSTNYDSARSVFTITNPAPAATVQQCFITVLPKESWAGGAPDLSSSQLVEGNYEISLSGGGGGGGGGAGGDEHNRSLGGGGEGGYSAVPFTAVRYLTPGVYRLTIGSGGPGGAPGSGHGGDGAPTSLSKAHSGETVAGFSGAESWDGSYNSGKGLMAYYEGAGAKIGAKAPDGSSGASSKEMGDAGAQGGNGFIKVALTDPVPQAMPKAAPVQIAPAAMPPAAEPMAMREPEPQAAPVQEAPAASSDTVMEPAPAAARPARKDRN